MFDRAVLVLRRAAICLALILTGLAPLDVFAADRPNVLLILADDLGWGDLGCYGGKQTPTPRLDQLAGEGARFSQFYAAAPVCSPSRCGILTGQFPARWRLTGCLQTRAGNRACSQVDYLDPEAPSLARMLKETGYATAHVGKWHLGGGRDVKEAPPFAAYGFVKSAGTWESPEPHPKLGKGYPPWDRRKDPEQVPRWERTAWMVDHSLEFIRQHKNQPWFVNLWLDDTHEPFVSCEKDWDGDCKAQEKLAAVLKRLDEQVGRLLDGLKAAGEDKETLVLFLGDNGPNPTFQQERTGGLRGGKLSLYEGGIRTPLIVRWPGQVPAGTVNQTTVISAVDLVPTVCALTGAPLPEGYDPDGEDLSAAFRGEAPMRTRPLLWEYGRESNCFRYPVDPADRSPCLAIREGQWKLLAAADGKKAELYDLSTDAGEAENVAEAHPDVVGRLTAQVLAWRKTLP